jgi:hypothetical protein
LVTTNAGSLAAHSVPMLPYSTSPSYATLGVNTVRLNDQSLRRQWHLQCTSSRQTERKGEAYAKQERIPGRCRDRYLRKRS